MEGLCSRTNVLSMHDDRNVFYNLDTLKGVLAQILVHLLCEIR